MTDNMISKLIGVFIGAIAIIVAVGVFFPITNLDIKAHTVSANLSVIPENVTLTDANDAQAIFNISNGSLVLSVTNYTFNEANNLVQFDDNFSSHFSETPIIIYQDAGSRYIQNNTQRGLVGLVLLMFIIGVGVLIINRFNLNKNTNKK